MRELIRPVGEILEHGEIVAGAHGDRPDHVAMLAERGSRDVRGGPIGDIRRRLLDDGDGRRIGAVLKSEIGRKRDG
jgi:hypothetical protein